MLFVREISQGELNQLYSLLDSKDAAVAKRAKIILLSREGLNPVEINPKVDMHPCAIRKWIKRFNEKGVEGIFTKWPETKQGNFTKEQEQEIVRIATSKPSGLGLPYNTWSLEKLQSYLVEKRIVRRICNETIRRILRKNGIEYRKAKKWLESNDPNYEIKKTGN